VCELDETKCEYTNMTYPIKKRIISDLFIDRMAALYVGETRIRVVPDEGDHPLTLTDWS